MAKNQYSRSLRNLGKKLRHLRDSAKESLAEAAGAVEIDVRELARFELGQSRPSEEILLLLISHFKAKDDDALDLWELAGYSTAKIPDARLGNSQITALENYDNRIIFTDVVDVVVNNYGVVMNFMQNNGGKKRPTNVARVGMSREHAKSVLQILQITLSQTEQKKPKLPGNIL